MKEITKLRIFAAAMIVFLVLGSWLTYDEKREQTNSILHSKYWH
jgi:hypothetical protein